MAARATVGAASFSDEGGLRARRAGVADTIIVDEAAQCQEAWIWGLLRKELVNLIMAGDPHQLPAQVCDEGKELGHGISMMAVFVYQRSI